MEMSEFKYLPTLTYNLWGLVAWMWNVKHLAKEWITDLVCAYDNFEEYAILKIKNSPPGFSQKK